MSGISIHDVDVARGRVARGFVVRVERLDAERRTQLAQACVGASGSVDELAALAGEEGCLGVLG